MQFLNNLFLFYVPKINRQKKKNPKKAFLFGLRAKHVFRKHSVNLANMIFMGFPSHSARNWILLYLVNRCTNEVYFNIFKWKYSNVHLDDRYVSRLASGSILKTKTSNYESLIVKSILNNHIEHILRVSDRIFPFFSFLFSSNVSVASDYA